MNPRRYQQVCDLFLNLVKRSPETRKSALDRVCADDADLRREVEAMLAADAHPLRLESFRALDLGAGLQDGTQTKRPPASSPPIPDRIGHYSIRRVIASGGMGVVYEAVQEQPHRTVALKVLRRGIASPSTLRRFEYESQILARLRHPHIAQVYEAGTHDEGTDTVPYFAMEYIPNAKTLLQYATETKLDHRQRLELFIKVCDAVHHGHLKGIIHRDLKPGNILVDSAGEPKIIDFGVARATDSDMTLTTLHTNVGQLIGTLQYMSPEQCEADPHDLDSRSDVYALGVVLYELLCGRLPYDVSGAPIPEAVRMIREKTPTRPSTIVRRLRGDTETIVLKALAKERDRRYRSAAQLADDIRHYLNDEPILARPPSTFYQFRKFARRNRVLVGSATVVLIALIAAVAVSTTYAIAEQEQRTKAEREAGIAQAVNQFLNEDLLAAVAPSAQKGRGKDVSMRDVLDEAAKRIEGASAPGGRFEDKPLIEAAIRATLGHTYSELGVLQEAEPHLRRALELRLAELGEDHAETVHSMNELGVLSLRRARFDEAATLLERALKLSRVLGAYPETVTALSALGMLHGNQRQFDQALRFFEEALELARRTSGENHETTLSCINNLAHLYMFQGRYDDAESLHLEVLESARRDFGGEDPRTLTATNNLAALYKRQNRNEEAEQLYLRTLEVRRRILGDGHPETLETIENLAHLYTNQGRYDAAEPMLEQLLESSRRVQGENHPDTLWAMSELAWLYVQVGRLDEAEPLCKRRLELLRQVRGEEHPETLTAMNNLGSLYKKQARLEEAEPLLTKTLELARRVLREKHADTVDSMGSLADLYVRQHRYEEAVILFGEALEIAERVLPAGHGVTTKTQWGLGQSLAKLKRHQEAEAPLLASCSGFGATLGPDHETTRSAIETLVDLYDAWHETEPDKGCDAKAAEWKSKLEATDQAAAEEPTGSDS